MQTPLKFFQQAVWTATDAVRQNPEVTLLTAVGLYLTLLGLMLTLWMRMARVMQRQQTLLSGMTGRTIEQMLLDQVSGTEAMRQEVEGALRTSQQSAEGQKRSLQRVGLVRFDAFPDVGGEQSFALAILDDDSSGFVLSGLHSRHDMRVYVKPVSQGGSSLTLSDEERRAVQQAQSPKVPSLAPAPPKGLRARRAQPQS